LARLAGWKLLSVWNQCSYNHAEIGETAMTETEFARWLTGQGYSCIVLRSHVAEWYAVKPLLYHWTLHMGVIGDQAGIENWWCYQTQDMARSALFDFVTSGFQGEPIGWHRHPKSGRRRENGDPAKEIIAF
jgi:hypothetical protein